MPSGNSAVPQSCIYDRIFSDTVPGKFGVGLNRTTDWWRTTAYDTLSYASSFIFVHYRRGLVETASKERGRSEAG